jgi:hypothetical protein
MIRSKDVLSAAHIFAVSIILVLSLSIITYPIGFLASVDIASARTRADIADGTGSRQAVIDSRPDSSTDSSSSTSTSDSSSPPDSSTDSSSEGSTTTIDSSGGSSTGATGSTGNDSGTAEVGEGSGTVDSTGVIENESSSVSETGGSSPADIAVSDKSSGSAMESNTLQTPEANSLSAADSSTESITSASAENPNAVVQPISTGDGQTVILGDVSNSDGTSAKLFLDKPSYKPGDSAEVAVEDKDANVDPNVINTIQIIVGTSKDDPTGTTLTLTETAPDSGKFTGTFTVASDPSKNHIFYDTGSPRAEAVINGVSQPGAVEVQELPVSSFQT